MWRPFPLVSLLSNNVTVQVDAYQFNTELFERLLSTMRQGLPEYRLGEQRTSRETLWRQFPAIPIEHLADSDQSRFGVSVYRRNINRLLVWSDRSLAETSTLDLERGARFPIGCG
jgi:hypothetical protein